MTVVQNVVQKEINTLELSTSADVVHRSPGITAIYNELKSSKRNNILDLGSASSTSFSFFSQLSCHIHFESVDSFLADCEDSWNSGEKLRAGLDEYLSTFNEDKKFDIILAWDVFNYLDRETLQWLITRLNRHSRANTLLHTIKYVGRHLPAIPRSYQVIDQYQIKVSNTGTLCTRPFPSMDTNTTLKNMPGYTMENTYVQQEGMARDITEHVLRYQPDGKGNQRQLASAELSVAADVVPHAVQTHRSFGLEHLCSHLRGLQNASVLDLGSKATHTGDFFLSYAEKVYVEDIMPKLMTPTGVSGEDSHLRQHALRYQPDVKFDVILAWDLFNFCTREQLGAIYQKLQPHLHQGTKIFTFFYAGAELPVRPQKCYVLDEKNIGILPAPKHAATHEELTAIGLLNIFRECHLANTFMLQPGMQRGVYEYIFETNAK